MACPHTTFARLLRHLGLRGEEVEFTADWLRQSLPGLEAAMQDPHLLEGLASDESDSAVVATCGRLVELHPPLASARGTAGCQNAFHGGPGRAAAGPGRAGGLG